MKKIVVGLASGLFLFGMAELSNATILNSGFDTGIDGWSGSGGAIVHVSTGGNPGGFLQQTDTDVSWMQVFAPSNFLGDLSPFLGGSISFDAKNLNGQSPDSAVYPVFATVTFTGNGGTSSRTLDGAGVGTPPNDSAWHTYSTTLDPTLWTGNLENTLLNLTQLSVILEFHDGITESVGFDNFTISASSNTPVPEPTTILLFGTGIAGLAGLRRKKL